MKCKNHIETEAVNRCSGCRDAFCKNCLIELSGKMYCSACKIMALQKTPATKTSLPKVPSKNARDALILGIASIFCFGLIFGPFAIAEGRAAKKEIRENPQLKGQEKATFAIILGAIGTITWIIWIIDFFIVNIQKLPK